MSSLIRFDPGDRILELVLVVTVVVVLASSVAGLISRRLAGNAALRHLVLFSALIGCLVSPALAWFCTAAGLTLVSIPIPGTDRVQIAPEVARMEIDPELTPRQPSTNLPPDATNQPSPHQSTTTDPISKVDAARAATPGSDRFMPPELDAQRRDKPTETARSIRGIATGVLFVWGAGTLFMLGRLARNCERVVRLRHASTPLQNERVQTLFRIVIGQLGSRREPLLLGSGGAMAPLAVAFGRPAIILPERLLGAIDDNAAHGHPCA